MNGDGLTDIVRVRQGDIKYWPGRGDGTFGTGPLGCAGGTFSQNSYVQMTSSPQYSDPNGSALHIDDVNGDGLADLVQIRFDAVDVWLNYDGASWTKRRIIDNTPASPSYQNRVRIVDFNGSGTHDILWADASNYKYIDLAGGERPWLLTRIENGLGKSTDIDYTTSTEQMLAAAGSNKPWSRVAPMPLHMVSAVTVRDNLGTVGRPDGAYVTRYTYRDPVYDGLQREFRGFSNTTVETAGDTNSPTSISETSFELGERPTSFPLDSPTIDYTLEANRWRDNPYEALKGLADVSSTRSEGNVFLSTSHASYTLRKLYTGLDGRGVYAAFESRSDAWLYDTSSYVAGGTTRSAPGLTVDTVGAGAKSIAGAATSVSLPAAPSAHTRQQSVVDAFGNRTQQRDYGADGDQIIQTNTQAERIDASQHTLGEGNWSWRTTRTSVQGVTETSGEGGVITEQLGEERKVSTTSFDKKGQPVTASVILTNAGTLVRSAPDAGATAQDLGVTDGTIKVSETTYDSFGNVVAETGAGNRCRAVVYDSEHAILPVEERVYAGALSDEDAGSSAGCGSTILTTTADYDRGLQAVTSIKGPNDDITSVTYDGFGRMVEMMKPVVGDAPDGGGAPSPSLVVEYRLPDQTGKNVSILISKTQDGASSYANEYHETYAYVDGLGRTVVTLSEADPVNDGFGWIAEGLTDYDQKGAARRKYLAWGYDGDPLAYDLSKPTTSAYGQQRYDAFGRAVETIGLDGTITLRTKYHALSADAWDAEDIGPGIHQGTYATEIKDGHGRVKSTVERVRVGGVLEERKVLFEYLSTGEVTSIKRQRGADSVERTIAYDSLGRMKANADPNIGTWRYVYNEAGDLVGTSDARGCGVNYAYDTAGRLTSEDYSPCEDHHELYDVEAEVTYLYDLGQQGLGRLGGVLDRGASTYTHYDLRGRVVEVERSINAPDGSVTSQSFSKTTAYDAADRPVSESTGASDGTTVTTSYTRRGAVGRVDTYTEKPFKTDPVPLVASVKRDPDGLVTEIRYGDPTGTKTAFDYDDLRRLRNLTTYRTEVQGPNGTKQMLLQDEQYIYDKVGNPVEIRDWRSENEWDPGFKPVSRKMVYDDLYRLTRIDYQYHPTGSDVWVDPYAAEFSDNTRPQPPVHEYRSNPKRVMKQSWSYDWLGNTTASTDDANLFYDRSLGAIGNDGYRLTSASEPKLAARYDAAGYMKTMSITRAGVVPQQYDYEWDEVGRLTKATRKDSGVLAAELTYAYDASDQRVRKSAGSRHSIYVFGSLELRSTDFTESGYTVDNSTEVPYLFGHGVRLARVTYIGATEFKDARRRIFLELGDHLGSTSVVMDRATGQLVERSTAYAYGAAESHYRPGDWYEFREDYRFTGKEDDIEVGLIYFGARYLNPQLGRWISADPLAVHAPGEADLNLYAYVHGKVLVAVDPVGLQEVVQAPGPKVQGPAQAPGTRYPANDIRAPGPYIPERFLDPPPKGPPVSAPGPDVAPRYAPGIDTLKQVGRVGILITGVILGFGAVFQGDADCTLPARSGPATDAAGAAQSPEDVMYGTTPNVKSDVGVGQRKTDGKSVAERKHEHHSDPVFMGGDKKQPTTTIAESKHKELHSKLNSFLAGKTDAEGNNMRPTTANPGRDIRTNFSRYDRLKAMAEFYTTNKQDFPEAAADFFKQNPEFQPE